MKQPTQPVKSASLNRTIFFYSLAALAISVTLLGLFLWLDQRVQTTQGIVASTYTKRAMMSRKQTGEQEWAAVKYTVDGKEYRKGAQVPREMQAHDRQHVSVRYYPGLPQFPWIFEKSNGILAMLFVLVGGVALIALFTGLDVRKNALSIASRAGKTPGKKKRAEV